MPLILLSSFYVIVITIEGSLGYLHPWIYAWQVSYFLYDFFEHAETNEEQHNLQPTLLGLSSMSKDRFCLRLLYLSPILWLYLNIRLWDHKK